jgi:hypothetical protein
MNSVRITVCLLTAALGACSDPPICTTESVPAIELEVHEIGGGLAEELARGVVQDGAYQDSLVLWSWAPGAPIVPISYAAAFEREGTYSLHLEAAGHQPWDRAGIRVTRDECHVLTARVIATLARTVLP